MTFIIRPLLLANFTFLNISTFETLSIYVNTTEKHLSWVLSIIVGYLSFYNQAAFPDDNQLGHDVPLNISEAKDISKDQGRFYLTRGK